MLLRPGAGGDEHAPLEGRVELALGASTVGFFAWAYACARLPVARVSASLYAVPVVAIAVALVWLGELPSVASVAGGALALAGVALATRGAKAAPASSPEAPASSARGRCTPKPAGV